MHLVYPQKSVEHPPESVEHPPESVEHPPESVEHPPDAVSLLQKSSGLQKNDLPPPLGATTAHSLRWYESHSRPAAAATGNRSAWLRFLATRHTNAPPTTKKWRSGHVWPLKPHPTRHRLTRPTPPPSNFGHSATCFIIKH